MKPEHLARTTLAACAFLGLALPALAGEAKVQAKQSLAGLLAPRDGASPADAPAGLSPGEIASRLGMWAGGLLVAGFGLLAVRRVRNAKGGARPGGEGIEVVGHAMLSHKHAVFVLRVSGRRLVVGVSGDRMAALGMVGEVGDVDAAAPSSHAPSSHTAGKPAAGSHSARPPCDRSAQGQGFSVRPGDREAVAAARRMHDADLLPYRKQMDRLRGLLRGMRDEGLRGDAAGGEAEGDAQGEARRP